MSQLLPIAYGPQTPFDENERRLIDEVHRMAMHSSTPGAADLGRTIEQQVASLDQLGAVLAGYPSPIRQQQLGERKRGLSTLVEALSRTNPANFEFFLPTRAIVGRALVMAESNFYRLLRHVCVDVCTKDHAEKCATCAAGRLRVCLYTKLAEEVLSTLASDDHLDRDIRSKAVLALAQIWERHLTYRVRDFFPILDATWEARQRVTATGGTLEGMQEVFELFKAGCDPRFVDYFVRPHPTDDEIQAFREFLFGRTAEELKRMSRRMAHQGSNSVSLRDKTTGNNDELDGATAFYEFFRARHLQAMARRMARIPGPKRTAEGYVMISYLKQMTD